MNEQFVFYLKAEDESRLVQLPIPPSEMKTKLSNRNQVINTIGMGEVSILKGIGLRSISFDILLPNDLSLPFVQGSIDGGIISKPIFYLSWFREVMARKTPLRLIISRTLADGTMSFAGNLLVSLDSYSVLESGGGVGDYTVSLNLREYVKNETPVNATQIKLKSTVPSKNSYTTMANDTLWLVAKKYLGDGSEYKTLAKLNGITNYNNLKVGTNLKLK